MKPCLYCFELLQDWRGAMAYLPLIEGLFKHWTEHHDSDAMVNQAIHPELDFLSRFGTRPRSRPWGNVKLPLDFRPEVSQTGMRQEKRQKVSECVTSKTLLCTHKMCCLRQSCWLATWASLVEHLLVDSYLKEQNISAWRHSVYTCQICTQLYMLPYVCCEFCFSFCCSIAKIAC